MERIKKGDWVRTKHTAHVGFVLRTAEDGTWADVKWSDPHLGEWSKRMKPESLIVTKKIEGKLTDEHGEKWKFVARDLSDDRNDF